MIDKNDPRLTAFVLGELDNAELREITAAIDASPELKMFVDEIRETIGLLHTTYRSDANVSLEVSQQVALDKLAQTAGTLPVALASTGGRRFYRESLFYWTVGIAAALLLMLIPLSSYFGDSQDNPNVVARNGRGPELPSSTMLPPSDWAAPSPDPIANPDGSFVTSVTPDVEGVVDEKPVGMDGEAPSIQMFDSSGDMSIREHVETSEFDNAGVVIVRDGISYTLDGVITTGKNADRLLDDMLARNEQESKTDEQQLAESRELSEFDSKVQYRKKFQKLALKGATTDKFGEPGQSEMAKERNQVENELAQLEDELNDLAKKVFETDPEGELSKDVELLAQRNALQEQFKRALQRAKAREPNGDRDRIQIPAQQAPAESQFETDDYQNSFFSALAGREREFSQQLLKRVDPTGTREINLQMVEELGIIILEGADEDVEKVREIIEVLAKESEGSADNGKRLRSEFRKAMAEHNQKVRTNKTWKRVKTIPNTTRLMVGDKDELELNGMQVNVQVDGFRARVLIDCFYYNHFDRQLEGKFKLRLPDDASLYYFAFGQSVYKYEQNGRLAAEEFLPNNRQFVSLQADEIGRVRQDAWNNVKEARMVPREKAAHAYNQTVRKRVDPALVEWSGAGVFNANVFPLMPHKLHRVVVGYDVDLTQTDEGLVYELDLPEQTGECRVNLNVLELENAEYSITPTVEPVLGIARTERVKDEQFSEVAKLEQQRDQMLQRLGKGHPEVRQLDAQIDALMANRKRVGDDDGIAHLVERQYRFENPKTESIKLTLATAGSLMLRSDDTKEGSFWSTKITPQIPRVAAQANDRAVFLVDTSLSSQPDKFNVWLNLLESTLDNNRESLKKFAVVFFNVENHFWQNEYVDNNADNVAALIAHCQKLALEGATDLYGALERVDKTEWIRADDARPDLFLLSDGAANWGETNLQLINRLVDSENLGSLFAYQTGMTGTAISNLRSIAGQSGGAVFSVASEDEIKRASTAHTQRPWRLTGIEVDGTSDVMTAGRVQWVYPGQSLTIVGRVKDVDAAALGSVRLLLEQAGELKTIDIPMATKVKTDLASRMYGQVAVGQLESLGELALDVATAYARHFRITGQSCSLLMLESEADYKRFDIKPEDDLFVIKTRDAKRLINTTLENNATELADPKQQLVGWLARLESMPGMNFKLPTALKLAMDDMQVVAISEPLKCEPTLRDSASEDYLKALMSEQLDYAMIKAESKRRFDSPKYRQSNDEALKVLSNLVERNPGDLVLAKDVAYAAMELHRPAQAYHLLRRVTVARPYEGSNYFALGQCLSQLGQADMAMVYYEVAITSNFENREQDFKKIAATEYAHMLRQVVDGQQDSAVKDFANARLQSLTEELNIRPADVIVTMMWNTDQTDVDLHVIEPSGEECFYQHKSTKSGGQITRDITDGFGPEMYSLANAPDGEYRVLVKYYSGNQNRTDLRSKVYLSIYRDFGRPTASVTRKTVELSEVGGKEVVDSLRVK